MQLDGYVRALREDLAAVAAVGDDAVAQAARLLALALDSALGRRLLEALNEAALELGDQLDGAHVEVRLAGSEPQLVVVHDERPPAAAPDEGYDARITLRLPESLKARLEALAARDGVSVNTLLVQILSQGTDHRRHGGGRRLTGYGQS